MDFSAKMWMDLPNVVRKHHKEGNINNFMVGFHFVVHILAVIGFVNFRNVMGTTWIFTWAFANISGLGITMGAHRLWAHKTYSAHISVRIILMLLNSVCNQTSIYHWSRDHRVHHRHSETVADPHDSRRGFFYAHIGWLWLKKDPAVVQAGKAIDCSDLLEDPVVRFQQAVDPWFAQFMCFVFPTLVCVYGWGEDWWYAFLVAGCIRYLYSKHCTFLVNSAAHLYGDHPYDVQSNPGENPIVSFFAIGEGWHNWHHKFPYDYSASEFGITKQYNPTKLIIDSFAAVGLVWGRKRATEQWAIGRSRRDRVRDRDPQSLGMKAATGKDDVSVTSEDSADSDKSTTSSHRRQKEF
mmetsp:Transcript_35991/g.64810  ORF Transcript_35991/g.64810 Transcript_35991/m.64810 type:complete len:352 (+) Transcript_35991:304-1359(+)|eukprot:CAMPEP_0201881444 /NCGR_PEP_ID=MMETSP0902-20130614/11752_1 /ASSEMBLY_ACC=CAM_ASM_000551 /TAXON_ID=420261 /ORGANISM="Thalassiosira antarctica, Strain CCMP982" /LENGTH=351 /DNA_ID=CAMNT_0048409663 /DNA_START=254 /DNA_END=1309 /DNA_ORIENTATION=-